MAFAALPAVASLAAGAISAVGAISSAMGQKEAASYQAQVARNNAMAAEAARRYEIQKGLINAQDQDRANAELKGKQRAAMAASGFDMNTGTMQDIQISQDMLGRTDSLRKAHAGELAGWKLKQQANNFLSEAEIARFRGDSAMTAGLLSAGGSLIGGAGQFAAKWPTFGSAPAPVLGTPSVYGTL